MKNAKWLRWYGVVVLLSMVVIFFVGRSPVDPTTGNSHTIITSRGLSFFKEGMDVAGGVRLTYKIDLSKYAEAYPNIQEYNSVTRNAKNIILHNIDNRISTLGVSDYSSYIQSLSDGEYLVIEIGGVSDLDEAKGIIGKTVELEFKTQFKGDEAEARTTRQVVAEELLKKAVENPILMASAAYPKQSDNVFYQAYTQVPLDQLPAIYQDNPKLLKDREPGSIYPTLLEGKYLEIPADPTTLDTGRVLSGWVVSRFVSSTGSNLSGSVSGQNEVTTLYTVEDIFINYMPSRVTAKDPKTNEILNGAFFKYANVSQSQTGLPVVVINFDDKGKEIFCNLTEQIVGEPMAIFVWGQLVTSPVIREKICWGSAQIDGNFDNASAKKLVDDLNEGALPAPLLLAHEEKMSATLWDKALQGAMFSGIIGLLLIYIFMIVLYGFKKGTIALMTLVAFVVVLFAIIKMFGTALSLSGISAILLSIGMGVDANVLLYERLNEERALGKSRHHAIEDGYHRSWAAIKDGNMSSFMIAVLLFFMGTNVFKWFGTMMMVNIILTLTIIVPLTKLLLHTFYKDKE